MGYQIDTISITSPAAGLTNPTRTYKKFTAVLKDTIDARIYLGIHFRAPDEQGAWLGMKVANWIDKHYSAASADGFDLNRPSRSR